MERKIHRLPLTRKKIARVYEDPLPVDYTYVPKTRLDKWVWDTLQSGKNLKPKEPVYESKQDYTPYNPSSSNVYIPYNPSLPSPYVPCSSSVYTPYNPSLPSPYIPVAPNSLSAYEPSRYTPVAPNSLSAYEPPKYTQAAEKKRVQIAEPKEVKKLAPLVRR